VQKLVESAAFPVLSANLIDSSTKKMPAWKNLSASTFFNVNGVKVRVIGLLTSTLKQVTTTEGSAGVDVTDEEEAARRELDANSDAGVNILLTHIGQQDDIQLASDLHDKVALVVGGHTHDAIQNPNRYPDDNGAMVVQAGKSGQWLGRVDIEIDRASGAVTSITGKLIAISPADGQADDVAALITKDAGSITSEMDAKLGSLPKALSRSGPGSTGLGDFLTDAMRAHAKADVAFYNKTGVRGDLQKGDVHLRDIYQVVPFSDDDTVLTLKGSDLLAVLEGALAPKIGASPALEMSGAVVKYDPHGAAGHKVKSVTVGGQPLDPHKSYKVVTTKFLSEGGDGHTAFTKGTDLTDDGVTPMDVLKARFHGGVLNPGQLDQRWIVNGN
jgi:5'-nucleotidase